jgi:hypothetical protein
VRNALGTDGDGAAAPEERGRALEGLVVARTGVARLVLLAVDGNRVERADEEADDGHAEERRLGEEGDAARREAEEEGRVYEPVRMVEDEQARALARHAASPDHLDAAEEDAQREVEHDLDDTSQQAARKPPAPEMEKPGARASPSKRAHAPGSIVLKPGRGRRPKARRSPTGGS